MYVCLSVHSLQNPGIVDTYTQHSVPATVAKYAPSGFYIASGGELPSLCRACFLLSWRMCLELSQGLSASGKVSLSDCVSVQTSLGR